MNITRIKLPSRSTDLFHSDSLTIPAILFLVVLVFLLVMSARMLSLFQRWEWNAYDYYVRLRPPLAIEQRIIIVGYGEEDIRALGKPIMSDSTLATLIEKVRDRQPRAIGLDIYRDLPEPPSYKELANTFKSSDNKEIIANRVLSGYKDLERVFRSTPQLDGVWKVHHPDILPPPTLLELGQVAAVDLSVDSDNVLRRGTLMITSKSGQHLTGLGLSLALKYLRPSGIKLEFDRHYNVKLGRIVFRRLLENDGGYVRADMGGNQILIDYRPPNSFPIVSVSDVLQDKIPSNLFRDRVVLIGRTAESLKDFFNTPYSTEVGVSPRQITGVEIQANITSQIIGTVLDGETLLQTWSDPLEYIFILSWCAIAVITVWHSQRWQVSKSRMLSFLSLAVAFNLLHCLLLALVTFLVFLQGYWLPVIPALVAIVLGSALTISKVYIERERQWKNSMSERNNELAQEKEEKQLALETLRGGLWKWHIETDTLILSEEFLRLLRIDSSSMPRTLGALVELIVEEDRAQFHRIIHSLITEDIENNNQRQTAEFRITKRHHKTWINYYVTTYFQIDRYSKQVVGIVQDNTNTHKSVLNEKMRVEKYNLLIGQSDLFFYINISLEGEILSAAPSTTRVLGYDVSIELIGKNIMSLIHLGDQRTIARKLIQQQDEFRDGERANCRLICQNGSWAQIEMQIFNNLQKPPLDCLTMYCWRSDGK